MKCIINHKLTWFLISNGLNTNFQSRFCRKRGTINHLDHLKAFIREAFIKKKKRSTFFDLDKAYDSTWKYDIMKDLHNLGLRGRLPSYQQLSLRNFKVCVVSTFFDLHNCCGGKPVSLFVLKCIIPMYIYS